MKLKVLAMLIMILVLPVQTALALNIDGLDLVRFEDTSTAVEWTTDEVANATVYWGEDSYEEATSSSVAGQQHYLVMSTLAGHNYSYKVESCTADECAEQGGVFKAGADSTPPFLELDIPSAVKEPRLTFTGRTEAYSELRVYVGVDLVRRIRETAGSFTVRDLPLKDGENAVRVQVFDSAGNEYEETFTVLVDNAAPEVTVRNFDSVTTSGKLQLSGDVNEPVDIEIFLGKDEDVVAPLRSRNLRAVAPLGQNVVTLQWDTSEATDLLEYNVYRDDKRIFTTVETQYQDSTVNSGQTYRYRISATDRSCNEGALSDALSVQTQEGGRTDIGNVTGVESTCKKSVRAFSTAGSFAESIDLEQGEHIVRLVATDRAGNVYEWTNTTIFDSVPPLIEEHNLQGLSPSYIRDVTVRGKVNEKATVLVYIDDEDGKTSGPEAFTVTDDSGNFEVPVELLRKIRVTESETSRTYELGGYRNNIRLVAEDRAGLRSEDVTGEVIFAQCGFGNAFDVQITDPKPSTVNPKLILNGVGKFGFNVIIDQIDQGELQLDMPRVSFRTLSRDEEIKYDTNVQVQQRWSQDRKKGFVELTIEPPAFPEQDAMHPGGWTNALKELNLSSHRRGECVFPGFGCYKVPLMLELTYTKVTDRLPGETDVTGIVGPRAERQTQRVCIPVQVAVDQRIDPKITPNGFLKASGKFFEGAIDVIDTILKPLETIYEIAFYGCLAGRFIGFVSDLSSKAACQQGIIGGVKAFTGGKFDRKVAETGLCSIYYVGDQDDVKKQRENCVKCQESMNRRRQMLQRLKMMCDRVMCPAVPSLQKWIEQSKARGVESLGKVNIEGTERELFIGSSCAINKDLNAAVLEVKEGDYKETLKHKPDGDKGYDPNDVNCANQHPSDPRCCAYEYVEEWGTACGLSGEDYSLKESIKLAEQQEEGRVNRRRQYSTRSAICGGQASAYEPIPTRIFWTTPDDTELTEAEQAAAKAAIDRRAEQQSESGLVVRGSNPIEGRTPVDSELDGRISEYNANPLGKFLAGANKLADQKMYLMVNLDQNNKEVWRGYRVDEAGLASTPSLLGRDENRVPVQQNSYIVRYDPAENLYDNFFKPGNDGKIPPYNARAWREAICGPSGGCPEREVERAYQAVRSKVSGLERDIIIDPSSDLVNSFKCGCFTGMRTHLKQWRGILTAVRSCFKSIEVTGDGNAGSCQALLSRYVCDFIYSAIKCYRGRFSIGEDTGVRSSFSGFGAAAKNLAASGTSVEQNLNARYGGNNMFRAAFSEERLVNSMCLFAFTGNWKLDPQAIIEAPESQFPVESQPFLFPCERRYTSFDLSTNPPGMAEFTYSMGVDLFAGADLTYRVKLVCSDGFTCDPNEGFKDGKCDCFGKGEQSVVIPVGSGQLKQFDSIGEFGEVFHAARAPYRYDTARLEWNWRGKNGQQENGALSCQFQEQGGGPPLDCAYDIISGSYRCGSEVFSEEYAQFLRDPVALYPDSQYDVFALSDSIRFEVPILQRISDDAVCSGGNTCSSTKYLVYTVKNQNGAIIATNDETLTDPRLSGDSAAPRVDIRGLDPVRVLNTQGERAYTIDIGGLSEELFNYGGRGVQSWATAPVQYDLAVRDVKLGDKVLNENIVVSFDPSSENAQWYTAPNGAPQYTGVDSRDRRLVRHTSNAGRVNVGKNAAGDYLLGVRDGSNTLLVIEIDANEKDLIEVWIPGLNSRNVLQQKVCDLQDPATQNKAQRWSATIEIRDGVGAAGGSYELGKQTSIVGGRKQLRSVSFGVTCGTDYSVGERSTSEIVCKENEEGREGCVCAADAEQEAEILRLRRDDPEEYRKRLCVGTCVDGLCKETFDTAVCKPGEIGVSCLCGIGDRDSPTPGTNEYCAGEVCQINQHRTNECIPWQPTTTTPTTGSVYGMLPPATLPQKPTNVPTGTPTFTWTLDQTNWPKITSYYMPLWSEDNPAENEHTVWATTTAAQIPPNSPGLDFCRARDVLSAPAGLNGKGFYEEIKCQGSGLVFKDGEMFSVKYTDREGGKYPEISRDKQQTFQDMKPGWPRDGKRGDYLYPRFSIAVNCEEGTEGYIPWGSWVYIEMPAQDNGTPDPSTGWYYAEDTGGAFKGKPQIDIFSGLGKARFQNYPIGRRTGDVVKIWVVNDPNYTGKRSC